MNYTVRLGFSVFFNGQTFRGGQTVFMPLDQALRWAFALDPTPIGPNPGWLPPSDSRSGSNANGTWLRLPGGTQICWLRAANTLTTNAPNGSVFRASATNLWTFPAPFAAPPIVFVSSEVDSGITWGAHFFSTTSSFTQIHIIGATSGSVAVPLSVAFGNFT
ncbi:MAG: hypothetical protein DDT26_00113 [Dehalococcoidia bacterium]|nr:hypothetical protein [Chloroflexota bacterium]